MEGITKCLHHLLIKDDIIEVFGTIRSWVQQVGISYYNLIFLQRKVNFNHKGLPSKFNHVWLSERILKWRLEHVRRTLQIYIMSLAWRSCVTSLRGWKEWLKGGKGVKRRGYFGMTRYKKKNWKSCQILSTQTLF